MSISAENELKIKKNSIKYLHALSTSQELDNPILKSIFSTKRRLTELRQNIFLPSNVAKPHVKCQRCLIDWSEGPASYRIKPKPKKHKFARKIASKVKHGLALTEYQQKYLKKMNTFDGNFLTIKCKFCNKNSNVQLDKPKKIVDTKAPTMTKQKKKKKRDKFCGLNQDIVLSLTPKINRSTDNPETVSLDADTPTTPKLKLSKRDIVPEVVIVEENITESIKKQKKKQKTLSKLSEVLNSSRKSNISINFKNFLKSL
ncbi:hypothetical protein JTB14_033522 [Gonioctena quinquepunctata]|nr:hypothetical protein JTB14_033522 [Gonioctena quinquepunctata]